MLYMTVRSSGGMQAKLKKLWTDFRDLGKHYVAVGWDANAGKYPGGQTVAQVAIFNEFGTHNEDGSVRSPARPFMRPAYQENKPAIDALRVKVVEQIAGGKITPEKALDIIGYRLQLYIQAKIKANPAPPLAAKTLQRKRDAGRPAVTLIDTRRMLDTLTYKIYSGMFSGGTSSDAAKSLQRQGSFASASLNANAAARAASMRSARQVKAEKHRLKEEMKEAVAKKKRQEVRAKKVAKTAAKKAKVATNKAYARYKKSEARKTKYEKKVKAANERHARKAEKAQTKRNRSQIKNTFAVAARKQKRMAARDKRQAKGLSRIRQLTPAQKAAKAAREKLQRANKARLRTERNAEKKEVRAEKSAKAAAKTAAKKAKKQLKNAAKKTKAEDRAKQKKHDKIAKKRQMTRYQPRSTKEFL